MVLIALLVGCELGQKEIDQNMLKKFFLKNRVGSSPDYLFYFLMVLVVCIPFLLVGLALYRISIPIIVERLSA